MWLFDLLFSSIPQIWYVEERNSRSIPESPLDFEITRVDYTTCTTTNNNKINNYYYQFMAEILHSKISLLLIRLLSFSLLLLFHSPACVPSITCNVLTLKPLSKTVAGDILKLILLFFPEKKKDISDDSHEIWSLVSWVEIKGTRPRNHSNWSHCTFGVCI